MQLKKSSFNYIAIIVLERGTWVIHHIVPTRWHFWASHTSDLGQSNHASGTTLRVMAHQQTSSHYNPIGVRTYELAGGFVASDSDTPCAFFEMSVMMHVNAEIIIDGLSGSYAILRDTVRGKSLSGRSRGARISSANRTPGDIDMFSGFSVSELLTVTKTNGTVWLLSLACPLAVGPTLSTVT